LGTNGSVAFLFEKIGMLTFPEGSDEEKIMEAAVEAGAEDVIVNDDTSIDVTTTPENFLSVKESMQEHGLKPERADVIMQASTTVDLELDDAQKAMRLIDTLEDLDDVQNVHSNADISDEVMAQL
ncbi:MAG: YebC/PmpR family DNA-binding transcriptional regulator, partial [Gammaproteobacteria bacterium]